MTRQNTLPASNASMLTRPVQRMPQPQTGQTMTFKDVSSILRRRMWMIIIITIVFIVLGMMLWFVNRKFNPHYTSVGFIKCKMPSQLGLVSQTMIPRKDVIAMATASNAAILKSDSFLTKVINRSEVQSTKWYQSENEPKKRLEKMKDSFSAVAMRDTEYIQVKMNAKDAQEAKLILQSALQSFVLQVQEMTNRSLQTSLQSLKAQRDELVDELKANEKRLADLNDIVQVPGWQAGNNSIVSQEFMLLHEERLRLTTEIQQLEIYKQQLDTQLNEFGITSTVQMAIEQDPMILGYRNQLATLTQQRDMLSKRLGPENQQFKDIEASVKSMEDMMAQRQGELLNQYAQQELTNISTQLESLKDQQDTIDQKYNEVYTKQSDLDKMQLNYKSTVDEIAVQYRQLEEFDRGISALSVKLGDSDRVPVEIAQDADEPLQISFPKIPIFLIGSIMMGLIVSVGIAFLLEFVDDSIKAPVDVLRHLSVPLLGMIPAYDDEDGAKNVAIEKIVLSEPHALMSEYYRQFRTNLFFSAPEGDLKTLLITSSGAGCGKTTTAVNLSIAFAMEGKRILLVDANFRRSAVNKLFPAEGRGRGLSNVLVGQATVADVIRPSGIANLDLVDSGPLPPNPADLLNGARMNDFLESQKQYYDYIILDGPPALIVTDARILADLVDGTIAVVRSDTTSRGVSQRMLRELKGGNIKLLGVLLNGVRSRKGGYFEKAYQSYYDYIKIDAKPMPALQADSSATDEKA